MLREAGLEDEELSNVNGNGLDETVTAGKSNPVLPEALEEGELEDEEGGEVKNATMEQTPDQNGSTLEKVLAYISEQPYPLAWLISITGRVSYAT